MNFKDIRLWFILLFNRDQSMRDAVVKGKKCVWLTSSKYGTRINYYNPNSSCWGGSTPVEKAGMFRYRTFGMRNNNRKEIREYATLWADSKLK